MLHYVEVTELAVLFGILNSCPFMLPIFHLHYACSQLNGISYLFPSLIPLYHLNDNYVGKNTGPNEQTASLLTTTSIPNDEDFNTVTIQSSLKQLTGLQYFTAVTVRAQITNQLQKLHSNKTYKTL
jgi:hypothetical protein